MHCIALRCIALRCIALHYITLHTCITWHDMTGQDICIYVGICTHLYLSFSVSLSLSLSVYPYAHTHTHARTHTHIYYIYIYIYIDRYRYYIVYLYICVYIHYITLQYIHTYSIYLYICRDLNLLPAYLHPLRAFLLFSGFLVIFPAKAHIFQISTGQRSWTALKPRHHHGQTWCPDLNIGGGFRENLQGTLTIAVIFGW